METCMELLMLLALLFCLGLAVVVFRERARAPPATLWRISDPAVAHRLLIDNADAYSNRPSAIFPVALATGRHGERNENVTTVPYGAHWGALRCSLMAETKHPSRLGLLAPMQRKAIRGLVADLSAATAGEARRRWSSTTTSTPPCSRWSCACASDGVDEAHVRAMQCDTELRARGRGGQRRVRRLKAGQARELEAAARPLHLPRPADRVIPQSHRGAEEVSAVPTASRRRLRDGGGVDVVPYVDALLDLRVPDDVAGRRALRDDEMVSLVSEFLGSGTGSAVACVEWTIAHLVNQPEVQSKLRREVNGSEEAPDGIKSLRGMPYLQDVVLESLRTHPLLPFLLRARRP